MECFKPHICIPSSGQCRTQFAVSLAGLVGYFSSNLITPETKEQGLCIVNVESSCISDNRERLVMNAIAQGATHVCFIDDDMAFEADVLHTLARRGLPIIGTNYPFRIAQGGFTALHLNQQDRIVTDETTSGVQEVNYSGFGFCLLDIKVFKAVPQPWFQTYWHPEMMRYSTEDQPFAEKCRAAGFRWYVDHDASKKLKHVGIYEFTWRDPIISAVNPKPITADLQIPAAAWPEPAAEADNVFVWPEPANAEQPQPEIAPKPQRPQSESERFVMKFYMDAAERLSVSMASLGGKSPEHVCRMLAGLHGEIANGKEFDAMANGILVDFEVGLKMAKSRDAAAAKQPQPDDITPA